MDSKKQVRTLLKLRDDYIFVILWCQVDPYLDRLLDPW